MVPSIRVGKSYLSPHNVNRGRNRCESNSCRISFARVSSAEGWLSASFKLLAFIVQSSVSVNSRKQRPHIRGGFGNLGLLCIEHGGCFNGWIFFVKPNVRKCISRSTNASPTLPSPSATRRGLSRFAFAVRLLASMATARPPLDSVQRCRTHLTRHPWHPCSHAE